jgi:hypothetical protein
MGMSFGEIARNLRRHAGEARRVARTRNIYAYGFSAIEEAGILRRLRTLDAGLSSAPLLRTELQH